MPRCMKSLRRVPLSVPRSVALSVVAGCLATFAHHNALAAQAAPSAPSAPSAADSAIVAGVRTPALAPDGRLAVSVNGHLMLQRTPGAPLTTLTSGAAWDRDPAWTADGSAIVFASDRGGNYDLYRVVVNPDGSAGAVTALMHTPQAETAPSVAADGRVAFLRGAAQPIAGIGKGLMPVQPANFQWPPVQQKPLRREFSGAKAEMGRGIILAVGGF